MDHSHSQFNASADLRLPTIDQRRLLGLQIAQRAGTIMVGTFGLLTVAAIIGSAFITVKVSVDGAGFLEPVRIATVRPSEDGVVGKILVKSGDTVRLGQPLIVLDSVDLAAGLNSLHAQYEAQEISRRQMLATAPADRARLAAQRQQADAHVLRARAALRDQMVQYQLGGNVDSLLRAFVPGSHVGVDMSVSELLSAHAERGTVDADSIRVEASGLGIAAQEAKMADLSASMGAFRGKMRRLVIRSPSNGIVLTDQLEKLQGAFVRLGEQVLEVGDPSSWRALVVINENDLHEVKVGDSVSVDVPAFRELNIPRLAGVVAAISATPNSQSSNSPSAPPGGGYRVSVALDASQINSIGVGSLRRGYSANAKIVARRGTIQKIIVDRVKAEFRGISLRGS